MYDISGGESGMAGVLNLSLVNKIMTSYSLFCITLIQMLFITKLDLHL